MKIDLAAAQKHAAARSGYHTVISCRYRHFAQCRRFDVCEGGDGGGGGGLAFLGELKQKAKLAVRFIGRVYVALFTYIYHFFTKAPISPHVALPPMEEEIHFDD
jgi:hypothetical protein